MTTAILRTMPGRMTAQVITFTDALRDALLELARDRERRRDAVRRAVTRAVVAARRAEDALALASAEAGDYFADADAPRERQGRLERLLREAFFLDAPASGLVVSSRRFRRIRYLCTDVVVALAGILVAAAGFGLVVQEPLLYGTPVLVLFGLAFLPFLALGVTALHALSHELSERRRIPRLPARSRSAEKKRLRGLLRGARKRAA